MKSILFAAILAAIWSTSSFADILLQYDFDQPPPTGQPGDQVSTSASNEAAGVTGNPIRRALGGLDDDVLVPVATDFTINSSNWTQSTFDYYTFGFSTNDTIDFVTLDSLSLELQASAKGPGRISLYSSQDNFTTPILINDMLFVNLDPDVPTPAVYDLTSLGPVTDSIEFRLLQFGMDSADGSADTEESGTLQLQNTFVDGIFVPVTLEGQITRNAAIPEPSSMAFLAMFCSTCLIWRTHFRRR
jgi:hypothetical protein